jgi:solute carrier family 50 (sugar transporter)
LIDLLRFISSQLPNILGFTFGVVQMGLYMFYMNKTPVGKEAGKGSAATEEHVVVNIPEHSPTFPEKSSEMAVPRMSCAAEAAAAMARNRDGVDDMFVHRGPTNQMA